MDTVAVAFMYNTIRHTVKAVWSYQIANHYVHYYTGFWILRRFLISSIWVLVFWFVVNRQQTKMEVSRFTVFFLFYGNNYTALRLFDVSLMSFEFHGYWSLCYQSSLSVE